MLNIFTMDNKAWSEKILNKFDPLFKHRWDVYNDKIKSSLNEKAVWIDCGCGSNGLVEQFGKYAKKAVGVDIAVNVEFKNNYIRADIRKLPFPPGYADLITLRFVVEHFEGSGVYLNEFRRVLKPGGKIIIITTNILSPFIFIPKLILPYSIKNKILTTIFKVSDDDVFPTYHHLNSPGKFYNLNNTFTVKELIFISDLNYTRKWMFLILFIWHKATNVKMLNRFKTNMLIVLEKR